jgi:hypothetical protein
MGNDRRCYRRPGEISGDMTIWNERSWGSVVAL